ncbi:MAG: hypothetical protein ACJZ63_05095 [Candidatus Poseidoniaceae archaeon]
MDNQTQPNNDLSFAEMTCTSEHTPSPTWCKASTTLYAHHSGELPSRFATVGWQPLHLPGQAPLQATVSRTVQGLSRRATQIIRGEA